MNKNTISYVNWNKKSKTIDTSKWSIDDMIPVKCVSDRSYVLIDDIKTMCQNNNLSFESFLDWINGQGAPVIEEEGENKFRCFWPWDVERWTIHQLKFKRNPLNLI